MSVALTVLVFMTSFASGVFWIMDGGWAPIRLLCVPSERSILAEDGRSPDVCCDEPTVVPFIVGSIFKKFVPSRLAASIASKSSPDSISKDLRRSNTTWHIAIMDISADRLSNSERRI